MQKLDAKKLGRKSFVSLSLTSQSSMRPRRLD